jgi:hypothetical protein
MESLPWLFVGVAKPGGRLMGVALDWRVGALVESSARAVYGPPERSGAAALTIPIMTSGPLRLSAVGCLFTNERNYAQGFLRTSFLAVVKPCLAHCSYPRRRRPPIDIRLA